jgi:hypothetical protein
MRARPDASLFLDASDPSPFAPRQLPAARGARVENVQHGAFQIYFSQSAQRGAGSLPQGMIGTVEVEFFGDPSISLSE